MKRDRVVELLLSGIMAVAWISSAVGPVHSQTASPLQSPSVSPTPAYTPPSTFTPQPTFTPLPPMTPTPVPPIAAPASAPLPPIIDPILIIGGVGLLGLIIVLILWARLRRSRNAAAQRAAQPNGPVKPMVPSQPISPLVEASPTNSSNATGIPLGNGGHATLTTGQILMNHFRVVKLLGQGGFGAVYKGWDLNLNRPVAIKENLDTSPEAQRQFQHEAQILANLSHPNLPRVTDYSSVSGQGQYLIMDFVEGEDLQDMLDRVGALPVAQARAWLDQICDALIYLHEQEPPIIHRDIKPANIKITPKGKAMLVDFGIAKVFDPRFKTTVGARAVTPGYSPPEQYGQGKTDVRSDVYSLGATLYALVTGQLPPESVERVASSAILIPPSQVTRNVDPSFEAVILRACDVSTMRRYQSVRELQLALR